MIGPFIYLFFILTPQPLVRRSGTQSGAAVSRVSVSEPEAETPGADPDTMWSGERLPHKRNKNVPDVILSFAKEKRRKLKITFRLK